MYSGCLEVRFFLRGVKQTKVVESANMHCSKDVKLQKRISLLLWHISQKCMVAIQKKCAFFKEL
jgi:hypothetical protein